MIALKPGDLFLESGLSLATAAITELYRQRGFATATAQLHAPPRPTRARRTRARSASSIASPKARSTTGRTACASPATRRSRKRSCGRSSSSPKGSPSTSRRSHADREALDRRVSEQRLRRPPTWRVDAGVLEPTARSVDLTFAVQEGPQTIVDHILIVGNTPHRPARDPQRDEAEAGRAARPRGSRREPARAERARAVPPRPDHRAAPRQRRPARTCSSRSTKRR